MVLLTVVVVVVHVVVVDVVVVVVSNGRLVGGLTQGVNRSRAAQWTGV